MYLFITEIFHDDSVYLRWNSEDLEMNTQLLIQEITIE